MRLLHLTDGASFELDLHPFVTVVQGLDERSRPAVLATVADMAAGRAPGLRGLVEAHGILFDLDRGTLDLLDVGGDLDPVVRAGDIPRSEGAAARAARLAAEVRDEAAARYAEAKRQCQEALAVRTAAQAALDRERAAVAARPAPDAGRLAAMRKALVDAEIGRKGLETLLAGARIGHAEAWEVREQEQAVLDEARERRRQAAEACARLARALERARADRDPSAEAAVQSAADWLAALERETGDATADAAGPSDGGRRHHPADDAPAGSVAGLPPDALGGHLERLEQRRAELLDRIGSPGGLADQVRAALAALEAAGGGAEAVPEAVALADEWRGLAGRIAEVAGERPQDVEAVLAARQRLDVARRELVAAEDAVRLPELDRDAVEALEQAHAEVLDAQDRAGGRFAGGRSERRLAAARAQEQRLLDEIGFRTYADYLIGTSILHVDTASEARLEAARAELAAAEDGWAALEANLEVELDRGALLDRARAVRVRAAELLGDDPGEDVEHRLRSLRRSRAGIEEANTLRRLLEQVGLYVVDDAHLAGAATAWLADQGASVGEDRDVARAELAVIEAELADVRRSLELPAAPPSSPSDGHDERVEEARAALELAEQRLARHRDAEALVAELSAALEAAAAAERGVTTDIAAAEARVAAAAQPEQEAAADVSRLEEELVRAVERELAAVTALADLEPPADGADGTTALERKLLAAEAAEEAAVVAVERAEVALRSAERRHREAEDAAAAERAANRRTGGPLEEVEWFLLARLAAQRAVSFAGSLPLVVDDALAALPAPARTHLLDRLERMASTVQVVYLGDDAEVAAWAERAGPDRAAVVRPARPAAVAG